MITTRRAETLIKEPNYSSKVFYDKGDTSDIITTILYADKNMGSELIDFSKEFAPNYNGLKELWSFVHYNIKYIADTPGHEIIKSPAYTWKHKYADCKSMSLFIAGVLKDLKIPYQYRFAAYGSSKEVTHIYVVAYLEDREVILDATLDKFDYEEPYSFVYEHRPLENDQSRISGKPKIRINGSRIALGLGFIASIFLINKMATKWQS